MNILSLFLHPERLPQIIHQMNTHDFCGTDLVAGLLLGTLQRSVKRISRKYQRSGLTAHVQIPGIWHMIHNTHER